MNLKQTKNCLNKICKFLANKPIYICMFVSNDMLEICASYSAIINHIVSEEGGCGNEGDH